MRGGLAFLVGTASWFMVAMLAAILVGAVLSLAERFGNSFALVTC
jgi:hypothetical protein